jgi:hypothetical protein
MTLFHRKKKYNLHLTHPDLYFNAFYFTKQMCDGVGIVAESDHTSKKRAAELLMRAGFSVWVANKVKLFIEDPEAQEDFRKRLEYNRFMRAMRKFAKENNFDLSRYFPSIPNPPENIPPKTP